MVIMHEGPRYPGSLVAHHVKQQVVELAAKYRRKRKRATELPRIVSLLLAWEGAVVAGAFLSAIAYAAGCAYITERFDERTRRSSLVRYHQQRCALAEEAVRNLQASLEYYRSHAAAARRRADASSAALRELHRRLAERHLALQRELGPWVLPTPPEALPVGGAGHGGGGGGGDESRGGYGRGGGFFGWRVLGLGDAVLRPWKDLYVRWRLDQWRRELEALDREAALMERSARQDRNMAQQADEKLASLKRELLRELAVYQSLHSRAAFWRSHCCRSSRLSLSGRIWGPWPSGVDSSGGDGGGSSWWWSLEWYGSNWLNDEDEDEVLEVKLPSQREDGEQDGQAAAGSGGGGGGGGGSEFQALLAELRPLFDGSAFSHVR